VNGKPLHGPSAEARNVFQSPVLLPWRTVLENVLLPIEFRKLPQPTTARVRSISCRWSAFRTSPGRFPYELSGGMQQRAAIVRALVQDPRPFVDGRTVRRRSTP